MSGNLNVTDGDLQSLADALENMKGTLRQKIGTLNGVVDSVSGSWKGDAATAYQNLQRQVNDDALRLNEILEFIREAVVARSEERRVGKECGGRWARHVWRQ